MKTKSRWKFRLKSFVIAVVLGLIGGSTLLLADEALTTHPDSSTWPDLFATDFSNAIRSPDVWSWNGGVLSSTNKDQAIWSKQNYENFILDFEFKLEPASNSGAFVYSTDISSHWVANTVEIQILDDPAPKWAKVPPCWRCGGIFGHSVPMKSVVKKAGEWNRMTIRCQGPHIQVLLNGTLVTDANMKDWTSGKKNPDGSDIPSWMPRPLAQMATKGHVGFQGAHAGVPTHFRNIKIKSID